MEVVGSVTKELDLLVVADPLSQSGKAKKARKYGLRILHEPVFCRVLRGKGGCSRVVGLDGSAITMLQQWLDQRAARGWNGTH